MATDELITHVLPARGMALLHGQAHSGKSHLALDWALSLATGFADREPPWPVPALEAQRVLYAGAPAWDEAWARRVRANLMTNGDTFRHASDLPDDRLIDELNEFKPVLLVYDMGRSTFEGTNGLLKFLRQRRKELGCTILLVRLDAPERVRRECDVVLKLGTAASGQLQLLLEHPDKHTVATAPTSTDGAPQWTLATRPGAPEHA